MNEGKYKGDEVKQRGKVRPKKNHPWKRSPTSEVVRFAKEQSEVSNVNNFLIGGGKTQK